MSSNGRGIWLWTVFAAAAMVSAAWSHPGPGIVVDGGGQVYFVHGIRNRILRLDPAGKVTTFVEGVGGGKLSNPHHLVLDAAGNLFSVGDRDGQVWKISPAGEQTPFYPPPNGPGLRLTGGGGDPFTIDPAGNLLCVHHRQFQFCQLLKIAADGRLSVLAGGDWGHADGTGPQARFADLHGAGFAWARDGSLLVTDSGSCVRRVTPQGAVTTLAGAAAEGFADAPARAARFRGAMGLAVDVRGNVFVADAGNRRVRKITPDGMVVTVAGSGKRGGNDGPALEAGLENPTGVAVGRDGTVYVLDFVGDHPRVRKLGLDGQVTTAAVTP